MKRTAPSVIARHLLDGVATALLLASVLVVALWVRSCSTPEHLWVCYRSGRIDSLKVQGGAFTFARRHTPYPLRKTATFREAGPRVEPRLVTGSYPVQRRIGPVLYASAPAAPPPTEEQERRAGELLGAAQAFDAVLWPDDPQERREWTARRARAYREAFRAERHLKAARASMWLVTVPGWLLLLPLAALPAARALPAWRRWRAWQTSRPRTCDHCGGKIAPGETGCGACVGARAVSNRGGAPSPADAAAITESAPLDPAVAPEERGGGFDLPRRVPYNPRQHMRTRPPPRRPRPTP